MNVQTLVNSTEWGRRSIEDQGKVAYSEVTYSEVLLYFKKVKTENRKMKTRSSRIDGVRNSPRTAGARGGKGGFKKLTKPSSDELKFNSIRPFGGM